jgi:hypothetical protein
MIVLVEWTKGDTDSEVGTVGRKLNRDHEQ